MEIKKISASEINYILNRLYVNQVIDSKNYGSIIEDMLEILETHPQLTWKTKKEMSFWYDKIPELNLYREYLERKKELPQKKGIIERILKFKIRKKKNTKGGND